MKKINSKMVKRLFNIWGAVSLLVLSFSCKSAPGRFKVNPLDLLDNDNAVFLAVPKNADPELITEIIKNNVPDISDKDTKTALDHIDKAYIGLSGSKKNTTYQCAASCNIPKAFVPNIFSKKKGFTQTVYKTGNRSYDIYNNDSLSISVPEGSTLILGRNVPSMLDVYENISETGFNSSEEESVLDDFHYNFLTTCTDEIRFFANKPQTFLTVLTGVNLDLKLQWVRGTMKLDPNNADQYLLDLDFNFKNQKFVKAGKALLSLAFGLTDSSSGLDSPTELSISGIKLNKKQVYKILTF